MPKTISNSTLSDVAKLAGVGVATASRAVNGGVNVSPATLKKIRSAIQQLGYKPNHAARILKGGRTKMVGLMVPSIANAFFARCAEAAGEVALLHDSLLIFAVSSNRPEAQVSSLEILMRHRPDGLLLVPAASTSEPLLSFVRHSPVPIVTFDRPLIGSRCVGVSTDNYEAARTATAHLIAHGRRRILCFGGESSLFTIAERLRGYRQAVEEAGLPVLIDTSLDEEGSTARSLLRSHLARTKPPDAVFTLKNSVTVAAFQALQQLRVAIPGRVALLGFDDFDLAGTLQPSISVVQQPVKEVGRRAAELLFARLESGASAGRASNARQNAIVLANRLVLRASCGCTGKTQELSSGDTLSPDASTIRPPSQLRVSK